MKVENVKVYDLEESIKASKYPMCVNIDDVDGAPTKTTLKLASSGKGEGHDQFLTGIRVAFDLTFSNKAWVEAERYRFFEFVSSQSTMHRIAKFSLEKNCNKYVTKNTIKECKRLLKIYNKEPNSENYLHLLYNIPSGFELTARITTNYRALKTIYSQRKNHRLPEWREFCSWCESLPYFKEWFTKGVDNENN